MNELQPSASMEMPEPSGLLYRSEAFPEDLDDGGALQPMGWHPLERLAVALPLLCLLALMIDWFRP